MNSGRPIMAFDLERPLKMLVPNMTPLRRPRNPPEPECRVCNQGRSGLPGDNHSACRTREREWSAQVVAVLSGPQVQAAQAWMAAAGEELERTIRGLLATMGVLEWLVERQLDQWYDRDEEDD